MSDRCEEYELLISRKLDGDLSPAEEDVLREHLRTCPDCRALAQAMAAASRALRSDSAEPPEALVSSVMERIDAYGAGPKRRSRRPWAGPLIAACLVLVIGAGGISAWLGTHRMGSASGVSYEAAAAAEEGFDSAANGTAAEAPMAEAPMPMPEEAPEPAAFAAYDAKAPAAGAGFPDTGAAEAAEAEADAAPPEAAESAQYAGRDPVAALRQQYPLETPAQIPPDREAAFQALLTDAHIAPPEARDVICYAEYRGVIYEFSTDGTRLFWRDAAEGQPTASSADIEALIAALK